MIPGTADLDPARDHRTRGGIEPVPGAAIEQPAGDHDTVGVQVVPGAGVLHPSGGHVTVRTQVVPLAVFLLPTRHHGGGVVEEVAASVDDGPSADGTFVGSSPVPAATDREPAGLGRAVGDKAPGVAGCTPGTLTQPVRLGDAGGIGNAE